MRMNVTINRAWYGLLLLNLASLNADQADKIPLDGVWHDLYFAGYTVVTLGIALWGVTELFKGIAAIFLKVSEAPTP